MSSAPKVSIVVPAYNAASTLHACLESLCAQTYPQTEFEILIVDNGSRDETRAIIETYAPRVQYVRENKRGRSAAQNCGIAHARGEIIALTDADCIAAPQWLGYLMESFYRRWNGMCDSRGCGAG